MLRNDWHFYKVILTSGKDIGKIKNSQDINLELDNVSIYVISGSL